MEDFLSELAEIVEVDAVAPGDVLEEFEDWDSLAVLSVIAMIDGKYGVTVSGDQVRGAGTAGALFDLVQSKKK